MIWSQRHKKSPYPTPYKLKDNIRKFIQSLSGDDFLSLLSDVLKENEKMILDPNKYRH